MSANRRNNPSSNYVKQRRPKDENAPPNLIRMKAYQGETRYINRAAELLLQSQKKTEGNEKQENFDSVVFSAIGGAIPSALRACSTIRSKIFNLHQITEIKEQTVHDVRVPREQGLDEVSFTKQLSVLEITLTRNPTDAQKKSNGYQPPNKVKENEKEATLEEIIIVPGSNHNRDNYVDRKQNDRYASKYRNQRGQGQGVRGKVFNKSNEQGRQYNHVNNRNVNGYRGPKQHEHQQHQKRNFHNDSKSHNKPRKTSGQSH